MTFFILLVGLADSNSLLGEARRNVNDSTTLLRHVLTEEKAGGFLGRPLDRLEHFWVTHVPVFLQQLGRLDILTLSNLVLVRHSAVGLAHIVDDIRGTGTGIENDLNVQVGVEHGGNPGVEWVDPLLIGTPLVQGAGTTDSGSENLHVVTLVCSRQSGARTVRCHRTSCVPGSRASLSRGPLAFECVCTRLCLLLRRLNFAAGHRERGRMERLDLTCLTQVCLR